MSNSIINSTESELRWVEQIYKTFNQELIVDIDDPPCVFRVPKNLKDSKPEAYAPRQIGLGPYHHLRPEFYVLQRQKIAAINEFLEADKFENFQSIVPSRLLEIEPIVRACYNEYIDINGITLALILAIDSLYLLHILPSHDHEKGESSVVAPLGRDLFVLENQIPYRVLNEIMLALEIIHKKDDPTLSFMYFPLCKARSPLILSEEKEFISDTKSPHLLGYMYHLIVNNGCEPPSKAVKAHLRSGRKQSTFTQNMLKAAQVAATLQIGVAGTLQRVAQFAQSVEEIAGVVAAETEQTDEDKPTVVEIDIPSASQLHGTAKVQFKKLTPGGIRHVKFMEEENTLYLPEITLKEDSEVILRNLMAYEAAAATPESGSLELAEYVDLMCGIVDTDKDVALLIEAEIIKADDDISKEQIAEIFNGISKSTGKEKKKKSKIEEAIGELNKQYDNTFRGKACKLLNKTIDKSWKFLVLLSTLLVVLLLALQAICSIFDCSKRWSGLSAYLISLPF